MPLALTLASEDDLHELMALKDETSARLTKDFGAGHWTSVATERGTLHEMRTGRMYVAWKRGRMQWRFPRMATTSLSRAMPSTPTP